LSGNEAKTPSEVLVYGRNGGSANSVGWSIRVVPNKFPALGIEGNLDKEGEGLFDKMNGIGAHEVIIESPDHSSTMATLSERALEDVLWAYRDRMLDLKNDKRFRYVLIFKNHGEAAGAYGGAHAFAADCAADRSAAGTRRSGQLLALLRRERALHFL
jgi:UDPglucose--hexose-1-phosphate uridylyltransferase